MKNYKYFTKEKCLKYDTILYKSIANLCGLKNASRQPDESIENYQKRAQNEVFTFFSIMGEKEKNE